MSFKDKVIIVTGSGSGIGAATAQQFCAEGANVTIVDYNEEQAHETADKCKKLNGKVLVTTADVSKNEEVDKIVKKTIDTFGKLDVLVNNAGIVRPGQILSGDIVDTYDEIMNTNLKSVVMMTTAATPHLIESKGCIVNVSSVAAISKRLGSVYPMYAVSKTAVSAFTELSALELGAKGVRVNAINPGPVRTNLLKAANLPEDWQEYEAATVLGRSSEVEEIAGLVLFLASDKARSITGCNYPIDNGMILK